ncbi:ATP-binding protein [Saccharothrix syringae]|uniref:ATP-binding protein n=1 Tax=Saccharothrix syringae TaxID=103733 RepID=UPI001D17BC7A|nr:tetratricopeptide repeat protein [Saccharothrix syringae]
MRNGANATSIYGGVVQAAAVHGGVHLHQPVWDEIVPRQLPATAPWFTGRADVLAALDRIVEGSASVGIDDASDGGRHASSGLMHGIPPVVSAEDSRGATVVISAIGGAGGAGKTWLALRWANQRLDRFPDGQLFVDLHGFSPTSPPTTPEAAVRGFLDALGVDPSRIPPDLEGQAALYRSLVVNKRMLIVLDNAASVEQVTPLLPGGASCTVLVTSRKTLNGLITRHGARHVSLGMLTDGEARELLESRLGAARLASEPQAVAELLKWCRGFPLALGILAGRAHAHPALPLVALTGELRELGVEALDNDDDPAVSLPAVLAASYRALTAAQQQVFSLVGVAPGPDIGLLAAASLTGLPPVRAQRVLRTLQEASLLTQDGRGRYTMHDLIRAYATTVAHRDLPTGVCEMALRRVVDFYLHTAHAAHRVLTSHVALVQPDPPTPGTRPHPVPDVSEALAWFDGERVNLLTAQRAAATRQWHRIVWQFAWASEVFHLRRGHLHDRLAMSEAAVDAAAHLPDPTARIRAQRLLGNAHARLRRNEEATRHLHEALILAEQQDDLVEQAHTHRLLASAWGQRKEDQRALEHATRALALYRALGRPVGEASTLNLVGWYTAHLGDYEIARTYCQESLNLHRRHQSGGEGASLDSLGWIDHHTGHHARAVGHYRQALAVRRELGDIYGVADTLDRLGHPHAALGHYDQARAVWRKALRLYQEQGRDNDAERMQRQLDALGRPGGGGSTGAVS